jgi:hypothetical protein
MSKNAYGSLRPEAQRFKNYRVYCGISSDLPISYVGSFPAPCPIAKITMNQLSAQDLQVIQKLAPSWQPIQSLWWRNPLDYRLELLSQPAPSAQGAAPTCALQGCRYALYRPQETAAYSQCSSHREATELVIQDALARHEAKLAIAG